YPTASALGDDLRAFAAGRRVSGRPVAPLVRGLRLVRRQWIPIAASLAVAAGVATWWLTRHATLVVIPRWPDAIAVFVDGQRVGSTSGVPYEVAVSPGWHKLHYEAEGMDPDLDEVAFERGGTIPTKVFLLPSKGNELGREAFVKRFHTEPPESLEVA